MEEISSESNVHIHGICIGAYLFAMTTLSANNDMIPFDSITSIIWVGWWNEIKGLLFVKILFEQYTVLSIVNRTVVDSTVVNYRLSLHSYHPWKDSITIGGAQNMKHGIIESRTKAYMPKAFRPAAKIGANALRHAFTSCENSQFWSCVRE